MNLSRRYCKSTFKLAFSSFKIGQLLSTKDKIPSDLKSSVVYKFTCHCKTMYIGQTRRHLSTRIQEHLVKSKSSHIFIHLDKNPKCKAIADKSCFEVIDSDNYQFKLRLKEGIAIS